MAREFSIIVGIDATRAKRGAREFDRSSKTVRRASQRMNRGIDRTKNKMTALITTVGRLRGFLTIFATGFLGAGGIFTVIRTLSQFTSALSKVEALLGDRGVGGAMVALSNRARELGATTVFTATQAAEGMQFLTLAGFDALEVYEAIGPALNLAQAGALELGQAADIVSNIMAGFNVEAADTVEVVDALAFVASRTNTNIQQLGEAMKFVAPVAGAVGVNVSETAAALGILGNSGLQASLAGTSLRRVLSGLLNPSREATQVLADMGLRSEDLVAALSEEGGLLNVINQLAEAGIGAAEAFTLFGQRGAPGLLSLINQREKLGDLNVTMEDITGTAKNMAQIMTDNLGGDARLALSAVQEGIIQMGEAGLTDFLRGATQQFAGFIRGLTDIHVNMLTATDAMKKGIAAGESFKDNLELVRTAAIALVLVLSRNLILTLATTIFNISAAIVSTNAFTASLFGLTTATKSVTAGFALMRTALIATGVGLAAVAAGALVNWFLSTKDVTTANEDAAASMDVLSDKVELAANNFDKLSKAEQAFASANLTELIAEQTTELEALKQGALSMGGAQLQLTLATNRAEQTHRQWSETLAISRDRLADQEGVTARLSSLNKLYGEQLKEVERLQGQNNISTAEYATEVGNAQRKLDVLVERQKVWQLLLMDSSLTLSEAIRQVQGYNDEQDEFSDKLRTATGLSVSQAESLRELVTKYDKGAIALKKLTEGLGIAGLKLATLEARGKGASEEAEQLRRVIIALNAAIFKNATAVTEAEKTTIKWREALEDLQDAGSDLDKLQRDLERSTRTWVIAYLAGTVTVEQFNAAIKAMQETFIENRTELKNTEDGVVTLADLMEDQADRMEKIWDQGLRNIQDAFADAFKGAFDSFEDFADGLLDAFKELLANLAAEALLSKILINFGTGGGGIFSGIGGLFGGGGGGIAGGGSSVPGAGGISGGIAGLGAASLAGLKGVLGAAAGFVDGFTAFLSGQMGVGGLFEVGAAQGVGGLAAGAGLGLVSGGLTDNLLGGRGNNNNTFSAVGGVIGSVFGPIGALVGGAIGSFVGNLFGGAKELQSQMLQLEVVNGEIVSSLETITTKQKSFFRGRRTTITNESLDAGPLNDIFQNAIGAVKAIGEALGVSTDFFDRFRLDLSSVNLVGKSEEEIALILSDMLENAIVQTISGFVNSTSGISKRLKDIVNQFSGDSARFIAAFEAAAAIDIAFALDPVEAAQQRLEQGSMSLTESYQLQVDGLRQLLDAHDGSLESLQAIAIATQIVTSSQTLLAEALLRVGQSIQDAIQTTRSIIEESLLNDEEKFNLRQSQIEELVAQIGGTTDPAELERLSQRITELTLDAFRLLDEDQAAALAPEFLEFLDGLDIAFADQVLAGLDQITADNQAINQEVTEVLTGAAETQLAAAARFQVGVDDFTRGVERFVQAGGGGGFTRFEEVTP